jgi:hypothetical protein
MPVNLGASLTVFGHEGGHVKAVLHGIVELSASVQNNPYAYLNRERFGQLRFLLQYSQRDDVLSNPSGALYQIDINIGSVFQNISRIDLHFSYHKETVNFCVPIIA